MSQLPTKISPRSDRLRCRHEEAGQRIDNFLARYLKGVPKSHIYRILRRGEVRVNSGRITAQYKVCAGDKVRIPPVRVAPEKPASDAAGFQTWNSIFCSRTNVAWLSTNHPVLRFMVAVA